MTQTSKQLRREKTDKVFLKYKKDKLRDWKKDLGRIIKIIHNLAKLGIMSECLPLHTFHEMEKRFIVDTLKEYGYEILNLNEESVSLHWGAQMPVKLIDQKEEPNPIFSPPPYANIFNQQNNPTAPQYH